MPLLHRETDLRSPAAEQYIRRWAEENVRTSDSPTTIQRASMWGIGMPLGSLDYWRQYGRQEIIDRLVNEYSRVRVTLVVPDQYNWRGDAERRNAWLDEQFTALGLEAPDEVRYRNRYFQQQLYAITAFMQREPHLIRLPMPYWRGGSDWVGHFSVMLKGTFT